MNPNKNLRLPKQHTEQTNKCLHRNGQWHMAFSLECRCWIPYLPYEPHQSRLYGTSPRTHLTTQETIKELQDGYCDIHFVRIRRALTRSNMCVLIPEWLVITLQYNTTRMKESCSVQQGIKGFSSSNVHCIKNGASKLLRNGCHSIIHDLLQDKIACYMLMPLYIMNVFLSQSYHRISITHTASLHLYMYSSSYEKIFTGFSTMM